VEAHENCKRSFEEDICPNCAFRVLVKAAVIKNGKAIESAKFKCSRGSWDDED